MARIVKNPVVRRNEILDVAELLLATKGYEQMTRKKGSLQCLAMLCERADSLKAPGSVANYLENGLF